MPSLVAGTAIGLLYLQSARLISDNNTYGVPLAVATSGVTSVMMWQRFFEQPRPLRFTPAGGVASLTTVAALYFLSQV